MAYKPTRAKYRGRTRTYYAVYRDTHQYRGGHKHKRTYVKRFYVSGRLKSVSKKVGRFTNKQGKTTKGIKVVYENPRKSFTANRGGIKYNVKRTTTTVTKIVPIDAPVGTRVDVRRTKPAKAMSVA